MQATHSFFTTHNPFIINENVDFYDLACLIRRLSVDPMDITAICAERVKSKRDIPLQNSHTLACQA